MHAARTLKCPQITHTITRRPQKKLAAVDREFAENDPTADVATTKQLLIPFKGLQLPTWLQGLRSPRIVEKALASIPWAAGGDPQPAYSTGQQAYWMLTTNPFTLESRPRSYSPETMFAIWRHTLGAPLGQGTFLHQMNLQNATSGRHEISWTHATYEGLVVAYADDITWTIENLNDANAAALLNGKKGTFESLLAELPRDIPEGLMRAIASGDAGLLYTYFIRDFNEHSDSVLRKIGDAATDRQALRAGAQTLMIGLSDSASYQLAAIKEFLQKRVFSEPRTAYRTRMLHTLSEACIDLIYNGLEDLLPRYLDDKANVDRWADEKRDRAKTLLKDPVHRIQVAVDAFCEMGDQEIYDLVGIESL